MPNTRSSSAHEKAKTPRTSPRTSPRDADVIKSEKGSGKVQKDNKIKLKLEKSASPSAVTVMDIAILIALILITIVTHPHITSDSSKGHVPLSYVWYYGWITAVSTGLGALPFFFVTEPNKFWMGISNAVAGGMMIAASYSLVNEGIGFDEREMVSPLISTYHSSGVRTLFGYICGVFFLLITKKILDTFGEVEDNIGDINSGDLNKMFLIIFVMTLHSLTEGIGIGVSFGGNTGMQFGPFVSLSLALHNVPEGLAVALILTHRKVNVIRSGLWAVFTSLPQPLTAIPAFLFVEKFSKFLPIGLGFASGAMSYVAVFELLTESMEDVGLFTTAYVSLLSCLCMMAAQHGLKFIL